MTGLPSLHQRIARCQSDQRARPVFVCCFGDSNTRGWGNESIQYRESYPTRLIEALHDRYPGCPFNGINSGEPGDTVTQALGRLERDVLRYEPDLTIVAFGVNDAMGGLEQLPLFERSLRTAMTAILTRSAVIVLTPNMMATCVTPLAPDPYQDVIDAYIAVQTGGVLDAYVTVIRTVASEMDVPVADAYRTWREMEATGVNTTRLLANGINHPFGHAHESTKNSGVSGCYL